MFEAFEAYELKNISLLKKLILLIIFLILFTFCGCETSNPSKVAEIFLDAIANKDFELAYSYIWPYDTDSLQKDEFIKKYESIFSALSIEEVEVFDPFVTTDSFGTTYTYSASYHTSEYGTYTYDFSMDLKTLDSVIYVDWDQSLIFPLMEYEDKLFVESIKASRGEIFSSDGELIAKNDYGHAVYMDVTKIKNILSVSKQLSTVLGVSQLEIIDVFNNTHALNKEYARNNVGIINTFSKEHFTEEEKALLLGFEGIGIDSEVYAPIRYYPYKEYFSHVIGYLGHITPEYLEEYPDKGYNIDSLVGKTGLEASYEDTLRGKDGKIIYLSDRWGNRKDVLYEKPAEEGMDLILTISLKKQQETYDLLASNVYKDQKGSVIVMDASTGAVEAICSYPSYDNNIFSFPVIEETWQALNSEEANQPMYDRSTQGLYPPGSLIKPFTIIPSLEQKVINQYSAFEGTIVNNQWLPNRRDWNSPPITRVIANASPLVLENALIFSDNIYFAWASLKLGPDDMKDYLASIGFEAGFDFDIPVKRSNILNDGSECYPRMLADMGYGQGELLVTPIQMASLFTAYANGTGDSVMPTIIKEVKQTQGNKHVLIDTLTQKIEINDVFNDKTYDIMMPYLEGVITRGTGRRVNMPEVNIAGKTGTAEVGTSKTKEISWFAGFWMDGSYDRLVLVALESKEHQGGIKLTIAKQLLTP